MKTSAFLFLAMCIAHLSAQELIQDYSGQLALLEDPPVSVELDSLVSDTFLFMFIEKEGHVLENDLEIDLSEPGDYFNDEVIPDSLQTWELLMPTTLLAGTKVHSIYFHYDNETYNDDFNLYNYLNCIGQYQVNAEVTFNYPVLGIIMRAGAGARDHLGRSNTELGISTVEYDEDNFMSFPGINIVDGCQSDRFILSEDRYTLTLKNNSDIHHDNYRVILDASSPVSTIDHTVDRPVRVFPNPTRDRVYLEMEDTEPSAYAIYDQLGQLVSSGRVISAGQSLSLAELKRGIYYMTLSNNRGSTTIKIIKK